MLSADDILKKNGKWMSRKNFLDAVKKECGISERQAYRKIANAVKEKEIRKIILPDRGTIYGVPDWPLTAYQDAIVETSRNMKNQKEMTALFNPEEEASLAHFIERGKKVRYWKNLSDRLIWLRRGAKPEEKPKDER